MYASSHYLSSAMTMMTTTVMCIFKCNENITHAINFVAKCLYLQQSIWMTVKKMLIVYFVYVWWGMWWGECIHRWYYSCAKNKIQSKIAQSYYRSFYHCNGTFKIWILLTKNKRATVVYFQMYANINHQASLYWAFFKNYDVYLRRLPYIPY